MCIRDSQKETYRTPYEAQPKDRLRQCVFGGSSNTLDFLPLDRAGNRRFLQMCIRDRVGAMNSIRSRAEEIILSEMIFV